MEGQYTQKIEDRQILRRSPVVAIYTTAITD
jgi:hypothetical protein